MSKKESLVMYGIMVILLALLMTALPKALDHQLQKQLPPQYIKDAEAAQKIKEIQEGQ